MMKRIFGVLLLIIILAGAGVYFYLSQTYPNTSPLLTGRYYLESTMNPHAKLEKHVMGFLPYWRINDIESVRLSHLSEINYFSLSAGSDGKIDRIVDGETNPGWREWEKEGVKNLITKSHIAGTEFTVTIAVLTNDRIENILDSRTAQTTLINEISELIKTNKLSGINIDFEYFGDADQAYKEKFTAFSQNLSGKLKKENPDIKLSLSLMPLSARKEDIFDFRKLANIYDRFIGMSYDYHGQNSEIAGPVAPMSGFKDNKYFFDVETMYEDLAGVLPKEKIIMGVPYYGWDWAVTDGKQINSTTLPDSDPNNYAAVISYARARDAKELKPRQCTWDDYALETWCWYTDKNKIDHQVWLADNKSISARFDYANKQKLGGIGIWVLGYDKGYADLWDMITKKFTGR